MLFDDLLKVEDNKELFQYKFHKMNVPIWFYVRNEVFREVIDSEFSQSDPRVLSKKRTLFEMLKYFYLTIIKNPFFANSADIYFFGSDVVNIKQEGEFINRLYQDFYEISPNKTQILESSTMRSYQRPKKNKTIYYSDFLELMTIFLSKFSRVKKEDKKSISQLITLLKNNMKYKALDDLYFIKLEKLLWIISTRVKASSFIYKCLFKIKKPKLIILEDASYGSMGHIILLARELGIKTAEYQHGYIGLSHRAYNHNLKHKENQQYFPDYFLDYGKYWGSQCRIFSKKISIGSPNIIKTLENYTVEKNDLKTILFISGGTSPQEITELIIDLEKDSQFKNYKILFRPHPAERAFLDERYSILRDLNIEIHNDNLYDALVSVDYVISDGVSTVLYEALYFMKKIYMMNTRFTSFYESNSIFPIFDTSSELKTLILKNIEVEQDKNDIWDKDWKNNYQNFINKVLEIE